MFLFLVGFHVHTTLHPGGASEVFPKLNTPHSWLYADRFGLIMEGRTMFSVITSCLINLYHWLDGYYGSNQCSMETKLFLNFWMALSKKLSLWSPGAAIW